MREFVKEELQRIQELTDFCMMRLRPSREVCSAIACFRLGEEGEQIRELDRIKIDPTWKEGESLQHMREFAESSFIAMTEDARCYSEIQNYALVAANEENKTIATRALLVTPDQALEKKGPFVEAPTDRGERRQMMRHTEESMRMAERLSNTTSERLLRENERLTIASTNQNAQLMSFTEKYCNMMMAFAQREHDRAKLDLEIERQRKKDARWDKMLDMGMTHLAPKILGIDVKPKIAAPTNGKASATPAYVRLVNSLKPEQREALWADMTDEQKEIFQEVLQSLDAEEVKEEKPKENYAEHSQANGGHQ